MNTETQCSKISDYWVQFEFLAITFVCDLTPCVKLLYLFGRAVWFAGICSPARD